MALSVYGIGTAVPEHSMSQDEALAMSTEIICRDEREVRLLRTMFRRAQVKNRYTCVPHEVAYHWVKGTTAPSDSPGPTTFARMQLYAVHAGPLAIDASAKALESSGIPGSDITFLITVSCTGFEAPGADIALIEHFGIPPTVQRLHVGFMGCHGMVNGLRAALGLAAANPEARILVCAVELCSLHYRSQWDEERILGNALFADGAAALVVGQAFDEDKAQCRVVDTGSRLFGNAKETITWRIGDHGFDMSLSSRVPELIGDGLAPWLEAWLDSQELALSEVQSWAIHPGGPRILDAVEKGLGLNEADLVVPREILEEYGNMSSPTMLFVLERLLQRDAPRPCVGLGFGPGLMAEAALFV